MKENNTQPVVILLSHTPEPEKVVAAAAKLCYSNSSIKDLYNGLTDDKTTEFLQMLGNIGHASPTEHASFTFGIENVSRSLLAQITRHRIASFSVQSQRYVDLSETFEYITPPEIDNDVEIQELYSESMKESHDNYVKLTNILEAKYIERGMEKKAANKKAIEDARMVLPNASTTKMIVTMNARSLNNFFNLRCCKRAQWEIQDLANQMLDLVLPVAPSLFAKAGAPCLLGTCPEGKMSCGKKQEPRDIQKKILQR